LHGTSSDEMISYTTQIVDCSQLENSRLKFWNYLRSGSEDHGVIARVVGSNDGGKSFPFVVWHRAQASAPVLEDGVVVTEVLDWVNGNDRVALRFETNTGWYWRVGDIQIFGDTREVITPVRNLTIRPYQGGVKLFWNSVDDALAYRIFMATMNHPDQFKEYVEVQDTSHVDPESMTMEQRYYQVSALMRKSQEYEGAAPRSTVSQASLGAADIRWNVRKNRLNR